jgi:hypothetical protein
MFFMHSRKSIEKIVNFVGLVSKTIAKEKEDTPNFATDGCVIDGTIGG